MKIVSIPMNVEFRVDVGATDEDVAVALEKALRDRVEYRSFMELMDLVADAAKRDLMVDDHEDVFYWSAKVGELDCQVSVAVAR